ncbi:M48 family peptidase [Acidipropionibacterium acidipropionici]|nr:M48 family peptidase [Acidipropionibacterium acidipropionici]
MRSVEAGKVVVRRMKTRWDTCQTGSRAIWLIPELMDLHMPDWRSRRDELNQAPLEAEAWGSEKRS